MLDIKFIRENPDLVKEATRKKNIDFDVNALLKVDEKRKETLREIEALRARQNKSSEQVATLDDPSEKEFLLEELRELKGQLSAHEAEFKKLDEGWRKLMLDVPNIPDPSVPEGKSEEDNKEVRVWGKPRSFDFNVKDHIILMEDLDLVDLDRGAAVSGFRGYFLKNEGVALSLALWQFIFDTFSESGYQPMFSPSLVRERNLLGTGHFPQSREDVYKIEQDDLYLSATSEIPLMGFSADQVLEEDDLPKKYLSFSPCFRREAGSYGKDTKGVFRVHEFFKIEQLILGKDNHQNTVELHEELTANAEKVLQVLNIPYRVVVNCGGDLGRAHVKTYDLETWIPSERKYRESHSSSYYHDFQTRRLNIRYKAKDGKIHFCYSLNNTAIATPRILISILENYQQADGSVLIPEVLEKYVGKKVIKK